MKLLTKITFLLFLYSCHTPPEYLPERNFTNDNKNLLSKFIMAEDSSVIEIKEGHFIVEKSLILEGKNNVTIRGKGMDKTVLSFKDQRDGAEGVRIANCKNITVENLSLEDAAGDNIKVTDTDGIVIRNVKSAWTGEVKKENGAYGLYPVLCQNVVVEDCEVLGASDAGIYVGQSDDVVIRNNKVYWNVAGIESENSSNVEIYNNHAFENTGGILVFDMPGLVTYGKDIRVYDNKIESNNLKNFAPAGNIVGMVPPGTGLLILATKNVEVYQNEITDNKTVGAGIISYVLVDAMGSQTEEGEEPPLEGVQADYTQDENYDPYPGNIYIHDNVFKNSHWLPSLDNDFGKLFLLKFGLNIPDVIWDGIKSPVFYVDNENLNEEYKICVSEGSKVETATLDAQNDFENAEKNPPILNCNE